MSDLRAENRRLRAELAVERKRVGDLRLEVARLQDVNDAHLTRFRELQGVPADCVLIPLCEADMHALRYGRML